MNREHVRTRKDRFFTTVLFQNIPFIVIVVKYRYIPATRFQKYMFLYIYLVALYDYYQ